MKRIRSWKGIRHMFHLKVRGQHTRTTGRTGLVVGYLRGKKKTSTGKESKGKGELNGRSTKIMVRNILPPQTISKKAVSPMKLSSWDVMDYEIKKNYGNTVPIKQFPWDGAGCPSIY